MNRATMMAIRLLAPAALLCFMAVVFMLTGSRLADQPLLAGLALMWDGLAAAAFLAAAGWLLYGAFRFWQWESGNARDCPTCSGLLGREREGRYGPYRKCLGCGRNVSRLNYA